MWERQTQEAAIDIQRDWGRVSGCRFTEKAQLCEGLMDGVLVKEKHPKGAAGLLLSLLGASIPRHWVCWLGISAEGFVSTQYSEKTHFCYRGRQ